MKALGFVLLALHTASSAPLSSTPLAVRAGGLEVAVNTVDGSYVLSVDNRTWLRSAPPVLLPGVPLRFGQAASISGKDALGVFHGVTIYWERASQQRDEKKPELYDLQTSFKAYEDTAAAGSATSRELIAFAQVYPAGIADTTRYFNASDLARMETCPKFSDRVPLPPPAAGSHKDPGEPQAELGLGQAPSPLPLSSATALGRFPAFSLRTDTPLNWFAPQGNQLAATTFGKVAPLRLNAQDGQGTMPLLMYNDTGRSIVMAPLDHFFNAVHETASSADVIAAGIAGSIPSLPPGFEYTTVLVGGRGINRTMVSLGDLLLTHGGRTAGANRSGSPPPPPPKQRPDPYGGDSFVLSHLGFWTDNGSPYYHRNASYAISAVRKTRFFAPFVYIKAILLLPRQARDRHKETLKQEPAAFPQGCEACNAALNCTLQDALLAVKADAVARDIPLRYFQWDDHESLDANFWCKNVFWGGHFRLKNGY